MPDRVEAEKVTLYRCENGHVTSVGLMPCWCGSDQMEEVEFVPLSELELLRAHREDLILNLTEAWHKGQLPHKELHDALAMTWEDYGEWVADPKVVPQSRLRRALSYAEDLESIAGVLSMGPNAPALQIAVDDLLGIARDCRAALSPGERADG